MRYRNLIKNVTGGWMFSLLLAFATTAFAEDKVISQRLPDHAFRLIGGGTNPWALPEVDEKSKYYLFRGRSEPAREHQGSRFVTPEILESLKQQQMLYQQSPGGEQNLRPGPYQPGPYQSVPRRTLPDHSMPGQFMPAPPGYGLSVPGSSMYAPPTSNMLDQRGYGLPSDGMSYSNPMLDVPSVSPWGSPSWGNTSDLLQRGGAFPWMPDAAVGGLPPIHVQPFADKRYDEFGDKKGNRQNPGEAGKREDDRVRPLPGNVFNPFSFAPNGNL